MSNLLTQEQYKEVISKRTSDRWALKSHTIANHIEKTRKRTLWTVQLRTIEGFTFVFSHSKGWFSKFWWCIKNCPFWSTMGHIIANLGVRYLGVERWIRKMCQSNNHVTQKRTIKRSDAQLRITAESNYPKLLSEDISPLLLYKMTF